MDQKKRTIKAVFSDLDGTLTVEDKLTPLFFDIISFLHRRNIPLVIVTGRGLSWASFLVTYMPHLNIVIGEGGGVIAYRDKNNAVNHICMVGEKERKALNAFCRLLQKEHPGLPLTQDCLGRLTDRAFELDHYLSYPRKNEVDDLLRRKKMNFCCSNVHFNFWSGDASKYKASHYVLQHFLHLDNEEAIFFGDSLNDESMFQNFIYSVGVGNIKGVLDKLQYPPKVILEGKNQEGAKGVLHYLENNLQ